MAQVELIALVQTDFEVHCTQIDQLRLGYGDMNPNTLFGFTLNEVGNILRLDSGTAFNHFSRIITLDSTLVGEGQQFNENIPLFAELYTQMGDNSISHMMTKNPALTGREVKCITMEFIRYSAWQNKTEIQLKLCAEVAQVYIRPRFLSAKA